MLHRRTGFSLVELMIVVAIIGILAAIAIPNYTAMQYKAKRSEILGNSDGIKTAELAYDAHNDAYLMAAAYPSVVPGKAAVTWEIGSSANFETLGWSPDGAVRGQYAVELNGDETDFTVVAQCDVDGDGHYQEATATSSINATFQNGVEVY